MLIRSYTQDTLCSAFVKATEREEAADETVRCIFFPPSQPLTWRQLTLGGSLKPTGNRQITQVGVSRDRAVSHPDPLEIPIDAAAKPAGWAQQRPRPTRLVRLESPRLPQVASQPIDNRIVCVPERVQDTGYRRCEKR